jgi:hypothetical protein
MPTRLHRSGNGSTTVPSGAEYIGRVVKIEAQKGRNSNWPNEYFKHNSPSGNKIYKVRGISASGTKIYDKVERVVLNNGSISFSRGKVYGKKNGNVVLNTDKGKFLIVGPRPLWDVFNYPE